MNTALLTGEPRRVPVRLVTVDSGGALVEVTEQIGCESANTQVLQVSSECQPRVSIPLCARGCMDPFPTRVPKRTAVSSHQKPRGGKPQIQLHSFPPPFSIVRWELCRPSNPG